MRDPRASTKFSRSYALPFMLRLILGLLMACAASIGGESSHCAAEPIAAPAVAEPSAAQLAAARELVFASGMSRSFAALVPQTMERLVATFTQTRPELAQDLNAVLADLKPEFDKRTDQLVDRAARIFTTLMSEAELKTADAFFESPAGRKYVEIQPAYFAAVLSAMQGWQQSLAQDLLARVRENMKKKGHDM